MSLSGAPAGGPAQPVEEPRYLVTSQPSQPQPQPADDKGAQR